MSRLSLSEEAAAHPLRGLDEATVGAELHRFATRWFPWHRAITGEGLRQTLRAIQELIPLEIHSVPSGTRVFGWEVPDEWRVREAYVELASGERVIDYRHSNLHVVSYSQAVDRWMPWEELRPHLHTLPEYPDWIPYRTTFFQNRWGFCLSQRVFDRLAQGKDQPYRARIDAEFFRGSLEFGELVLPGESDREILFSVHVCHPSLANDNLSSMVVATELARRLAADASRPVTYRFVFAPATIGVISWLALRQREIRKIDGGLVLANLGDAGGFTYKQSRLGNSLVDVVVPRVLTACGEQCEVRQFDPFGYDERQYGSPGCNLPVGRLTRTPHGEYPQYHTSADDLDGILPVSLARSAHVLEQIARELGAPHDAAPRPDGDGRMTAESTATEGPWYRSTHPFCEPPLGRHGLYQGYGWGGDKTAQAAILWLLNLSDGRHDLPDVARRSGCSLSVLEQVAERLVDCGFLERISRPDKQSNPFRNP